MSQEYFDWIPTITVIVPPDYIIVDLISRF